MVWLIAVLSSFLWRVRGGLFDIPANKIYFPLFVGGLTWYFRDFNCGLITTIAAYTGQQLYGWGKYITALLTGKLDPNEKECELIDELLENIEYITSRPKLYGFITTSLSGLIVTFIVGLAVNSIPFMVGGISAGLLYWLGGQTNKIYDLGKCGWNWGEIYAGFVYGAGLYCVLS